MNETAVKLTLTSILALVSVWLEILALPVALLMAAMIIDYTTGLMAAKPRGQTITSYRGMNGIAKKVVSLLLVVVGIIVDLLVVFVREYFGATFPWSFIVAAVVALWLTCNELISILENVQDIGVPIPPLLLPLVKNIRSKVVSKEEETDNEDQ